VWEVEGDAVHLRPDERERGLHGVKAAGQRFSSRSISISTSPGLRPGWKMPRTASLSS
jgi:hypothetical protein